MLSEMPRDSTKSMELIAKFVKSLVILSNLASFLETQCFLDAEKVSV